MIDLHIHSNFSDGSETPEEIIRLAAQRGLTAVALTDHDCVDGLFEFTETAKQYEIEAIPGIELSADFHPGTLHMLGYWINPSSPVLIEALRKIRQGREDRNIKIIEQLNELGYPLTMEEVLRQSNGTTIGRPHIAAALVAAGHFKNSRQVFNKLLARGKPGYADRFRLPYLECIEVIRAAGGIAVLAHPVALRLSRGKLRKLLTTLKKNGLGGVEVFYPEHNPGQVRVYRQATREAGLAMTGGTDWHGKFTPDIHLGTGFGDMEIPDRLLDPLRRQLAESLS